MRDIKRKTEFLPGKGERGVQGIDLDRLKLSAGDQHQEIATEESQEKGDQDQGLMIQAEGGIVPDQDPIPEIVKGEGQKTEDLGPGLLIGGKLPEVLRGIVLGEGGANQDLDSMRSTRRPTKPAQFVKRMLVRRDRGAGPLPCLEKSHLTDPGTPDVQGHLFMRECELLPNRGTYVYSSPSTLLKFFVLLHSECLMRTNLMKHLDIPTIVIIKSKTKRMCSGKREQYFCALF
jgi:hypothetical protein